tara:strand:- start:7024 stop:8304 length:1281 start_codon:yes stop_codon:yes gene_type:complete
MDNITVIILLAVVIVLIFISLFFMYSIKNSIKKSINKEIESINKDNDNKLNSKLQENTFEIKEKFQEVLFEIQKGFTKDVGELKKEVSDNMISNLERTQTAATGNIKDISEMISKNLEINNNKIDLNISELKKEIQEKLTAISDRVDDKLSDSFGKSNDIFNKIINKINMIEEAQNKMEDLSKNVTNLQNVLSDKQSRGAWGEVQLEQIISNIFPKNNYITQHKLSNGNKVDFYLKIPDPSFDIAIDSKFPFENYKKMVSEENKTLKEKATKLFKSDVKKHIDDIANKYIVIGETADYAIMFLPAEAVFAEIHAYHYDLVEYSQKKRVLLVSPTTITAILTTAYSVIKDDSMKRQLTVLKSNLDLLYKDFDRLENRMAQLKTSVQKVNTDVEGIEISSKKIVNKFDKIKNLEIEEDKNKEIKLIEN